ncbi:MAG: SDR family oxidoreductase [Gammaproteobacteria bacterium]|nr:SDR family oxidoreductase [Gammaproteobacteria bacterium]
MSTILVTGTNRGIGLEFARQYAADGWRVYACCRHPDKARALQQLAEKHKNISLHALDVADHKQIDALAGELHGVPIDILLNNAGVYAGNSDESLGSLNYPAWEKSFRINTLAAAKMAEVFLENVARSEQRLVAALSSLMGSMADNGSGGSYLYRSSKAALNAVMVSLAVDLKPRRIGVLILHPGWVKTDMGGPNAEISTETSVRGMRAVMDKFKLKDSGRFIAYDGEELPW